MTIEKIGNVADPALEGVIAAAVRDSLRDRYGIEIRPSGSRKVASDILAVVRAHIGASHD